MAKTGMPPEVADGGYWYVVEAVTGELGISPGEIPGAGYCAWYGEIDGVLHAAIRTPEPVTGIPALDIPVARVMPGVNSKPFGRIGGR